jgi:hypothetical protein
LGRLSKESVQVRGSFMIFVTNLFFTLKGWFSTEYKELHLITTDVRT